MKKLILLLIIVSFVASAGADIRYQNSGPWEQLATGTQDPCTLAWSWTGTGWQSLTIPGATDRVRANWGGNTVTLNWPAFTIDRFQLGVDEDGEFNIQNGGTLTTTGGSTIGNNGGAGVIGTLTIDSGGTVQVNNWVKVGVHGTGQVTVAGTLGMTGHLWMGSHSSDIQTGTIDINGGVVSVGGMIGLGTVNATSDAAGFGFINVNEGGRLTLSNIHGGIMDETGETYSIQAGSLITLNGSGIITLPGDFEAVIAEYASEGLITSDLGGVGTDLTTNPGLTTVFAVIPEPATMSLLGLGAMVLLRRKK